MTMPSKGAGASVVGVKLRGSSLGSLGGVAVGRAGIAAGGSCVVVVAGEGSADVSSEGAAVSTVSAVSAVLSVGLSELSDGKADGDRRFETLALR